MHSRLRLLIAGLATLVLALVIFFPARIAYNWFAPPTFTLSGVDGSIWSGSATEAMVSGIYLRNLDWQMRPLSLLTGKARYTITASPASGFIDTSVSFGVTGRVTITDLRASMPLQSLAQSIGMPGLRGNLKLQFERLELRDGLPVAAEGVAEVANLVAPLVDRSAIGGYRAEFFTQDTGVAASVEDTDGVVDLAGSLQISADRSYQLIAQLAAKPNTPPNIRQQLQFLGSPNSRGQHEMRLEGQL